MSQGKLSRFVAVMAFRRRGDKIDFLVFDWREDRSGKPGETAEQQMVRLLKENERRRASYKFPGGTDREHPEDRDEFYTGAREFTEETGIPMDAEALRESALHVFEEIRSNDRGKTWLTDFILLDATSVWESWKPYILGREPLRIDRSPGRKDEIIGLPVWVQADELDDGVFHSHQKPLRAAFRRIYTPPQECSPEVSVATQPDVSTQHSEVGESPAAKSEKLFS